MQTLADLFGLMSQVIHVLFTTRVFGTNLGVIIVGMFGITVLVDAWMRMMVGEDGSNDDD